MDTVDSWTWLLILCLQYVVDSTTVGTLVVAKIGTVYSLICTATGLAIRHHMGPIGLPLTHSVQPCPIRGNAMLSHACSPDSHDVWHQASKAHAQTDDSLHAVWAPKWPQAAHPGMPPSYLLVSPSFTESLRTASTTTLSTFTHLLNNFTLSGVQ
ncbi:hypothetical protein J1614_007909 [Plenodomus biglobosus]|nr:hypothetical protein J1614_007909 [Plenodomus biglobosus]